MRRVAILVLAVFMLVGACSESDGTTDAHDDLPDYGSPLNVSLASDAIPVDGSLVIITNATGEVFVYEYCGIPGALLIRDVNAYRYVFPIEASCMDPANASFEGSLSVPLESIRTVSGSRIDPGEYEFKLFYATVAPGIGVREANLFFTVVEQRSR